MRVSLLRRAFIFLIQIVLSLLASSAIDPAVADPTGPRPILVMEAVSPMFVRLPRGSDTGFALYNDGQLLVRTGTGSNNGTYSILEPAEAEHMRHDAAESLMGVSPVQPRNSNIADDGTTTIYVWDGQQYREYSGNASACLPPESPVVSKIWRQAREHTDQRYLKICDQLRTYEIASPKPWTPEAKQLWDVQPWLQQSQLWNLRQRLQQTKSSLPNP